MVFAAAGRGPVHDVSVEVAAELRHREAVMGWARVAAAGFAVVQLSLYQPSTGAPLPFPRIGATLGIAGTLLTVSVLAWLVVRFASARTVQRFGVAQLVVDSLVVLALLWLFAFDPQVDLWPLAIVPVLEGALRFRLSGALMTWAGLVLGIVVFRLWADATFDDRPFVTQGVTFAAGVIGIVAVTAGSLSRHLGELTERYRLAQHRLQRLAYVDGLTGLPNRSRLLAVLDRLDHDEAADVPFALVFVDLDGFKHVNDRLGHEAGDRLLCEVAERLSNVVRPTDTVARLAGDEFVLVLQGAGDRAHVEDVARRLVRAVGMCEVGGGLTVSASVGVAMARTGRLRAREVLQHADAAMYAAKRAGGEPVVVDLTSPRAAPTP
jgi:diguanylate cyclase (GGDEF)-like protein